MKTRPGRAGYHRTEVHYLQKIQQGAPRAPGEKWDRHLTTAWIGRDLADLFAAGPHFFNRPRELWESSALQQARFMMSMSNKKTDQDGCSVRLSALLIVRDEADVIEATIRSAKQLADEVLVVDTGSTDDTVEIARRLGARVEQFQWCEDFSAARNFAMDKAKGDWVLWLNAGEHLPEESVHFLAEALSGAIRPDTAYALNLELREGEHPQSPREQRASFRLFPNLPDIRYTGRVRETVEPSLILASMQGDALPARIVCHTRQNDPSFRWQRGKRNLALLELVAGEATSLSADYWLAKGDANMDLGDWTSAAAAYRQAIENADRGAPRMLEAYYGLLAACDADASMRDLMLTLALEAMEQFPLDVQLQLLIGGILQARGQLDLAIRSFEIAVRHGQVELQTWHAVDIAERCVTCLVLALRLAKRDEESMDVLRQGVDALDSLKLRRLMLDLLVRTGSPEEPIKLLHQWFADEPTLCAVMEEVVRGACRAVRQDWRKALGHLQTAYLIGCTDPLCLRWLSFVLVAIGETATARGVLTEWQSIEPNHPELLALLAVIEQDESQAAQAKSQEGDKTDRRFRVDTKGDKTESVIPPVVLPEGQSVPIAGVGMAD